MADSVLRARVDTALFATARFSVPLGNNRVLHAIRRESHDNAQGGTSITGVFPDLPSSFFALTEHADQVTGFLQTATELWEVKPAAAGEVLIYRVDPAQLPPESTPLQTAAETRISRAPQPPARDALDTSTASSTSLTAMALDVPYQHDLLVVYTPRAAATAGGQTAIEGAISNAVAAANAGYSQSGVALSLWCRAPAVLLEPLARARDRSYPGQ